MHSNLVQVHARAPVVYYVNSEVAYQVSGTQVTNVTYGFYQDQLFAAFIKLRTPVQFSNLKRHFTNRYGEPKTTYYANDTQTVYRWKEGNVKIKLKMKEMAQEMKMAVYYAPLAAELNQQLLESLPKDSWNPFPMEKGKIHRSAPLLNF